MNAKQISLSAAIATLLAAASEPAHALQVDYAVDGGVAYDDNVRLTAEDPLEQYMFRSGLGFLVNENSASVQASIDGRLEYWDYRDNTYSDSVQGTLTGRVNWIALPERLSFTLENSLELQPVDNFEPDSPDNRQQINVLSLGPNLYFNWNRTFRGLAELRYVDTSAQETENYDSQRIGLALRAVKSLNASSNLSLNAQALQVDFDNDLLTRDYRRNDLFMQYQRTDTKLDLRLDAGYSRIDYEQGEDSSHSLLRADIGWRPSERSRFSLTAADQLSDAASAAIYAVADTTTTTTIPDSLLTGNTNINPSVYEERSVFLSYAYTAARFSFTISPYEQRIDYLDAGGLDENNRGTALNLSYRVQTDLTLSANMEVERTRYPQLDRTDDTVRYGFSLLKQWSRHWASSLSYAHYDRDSPQPSANVKQNIYYLSMIYQNR